ncbi:hypothetical protein ACTHGU_10860 [Chitinophagaceae bacterium MMS25-I14]
MKHCLLLICTTLFFCACRQSSKSSASAAAEKEQQKAIEDIKRMTQHMDSMGRIWKQRMHEPDISKATHEVYRFATDLTFGNNYIFRIDLDTATHEIWLTTKFINTQFADDGDSSLVIIYKNQKLCPLPGAIIDSSVQKVSPEEWQTFIRLLEGSYYRRISEPPCPEERIDPRALILETMVWSCCPHPLSLEYHKVHITAPRPGSLTDACIYLSKISILTRHTQQEIWKQFFPKPYQHHTAKGTN